jgi:uncharacterized membrane protein
MVVLDNTLLAITGVSALLVIGGVSAKNTSEQLSLATEHTSILKNLGMGAFVIGWILCAYALSKGKDNKLMFILSSLGVLVSVITMKMMKENNNSIHMALPIIFAVSWLVLGLGAGNHLGGIAQYSGVIATALVIGSMMYSLPFQRANNNADGPGAYMFGLAWVIITFLNSMR